MAKERFERKKPHVNIVEGIINRLRGKNPESAEDAAAGPNLNPETDDEMAPDQGSPEEQASRSTDQPYLQSIQDVSPIHETSGHAASTAPLIVDAGNPDAEASRGSSQDFGLTIEHQNPPDSYPLPDPGEEPYPGDDRLPAPPPPEPVDTNPFPPSPIPTGEPEPQRPLPPYEPAQNDPPPTPVVREGLSDRYASNQGDATSGETNTSFASNPPSVSGPTPGTVHESAHVVQQSPPASPEGDIEGDEENSVSPVAEAEPAPGGGLGNPIDEDLPAYSHSAEPPSQLVGSGDIPGETESIVAEEIEGESLATLVPTDPSRNSVDVRGWDEDTKEEIARSALPNEPDAGAATTSAFRGDPAAGSLDAEASDESAQAGIGRPDFGSGQMATTFEPNTDFDLTPGPEDEELTTLANLSESAEPRVTAMTEIFDDLGLEEMELDEDGGVESPDV